MTGVVGEAPKWYPPRGIDDEALVWQRAALAAALAALPLATTLKKKAVHNDTAGAHGQGIAVDEDPGTNRGLSDGATIFFPHRVHGEPFMAAVVTPDGSVAIGGVHAHGALFRLDPDESTAALIRQDAERLRLAREGVELDEAGLPVLGP